MAHKMRASSTAESDAVRVAVLPTVVVGILKRREAYFFLTMRRSGVPVNW